MSFADRSDAQRRGAVPSPDNVTRLAARAAVLLFEWASLPALRKASVDANMPGEAVMMMTQLMCDGRAPLDDARVQIAKYIEAALRSRGMSFYFSISTDYEPDHRLREMIDALKLHYVSWPGKSSLTISGSVEDAGVVTHRIGYHGESVVYTLCPDREGWLISKDFNVPRPLRGLVIDAVKTGDPVAKWEPFISE